VQARRKAKAHSRAHSAAFGKRYLIRTDHTGAGQAAKVSVGSCVTTLERAGDGVVAEKVLAGIWRDFDPITSKNVPPRCARA